MGIGVGCAPRKFLSRLPLPQSRDHIEAAVSKLLRGLDIDDLAERAGVHRDSTSSRGRQPES